MVIVGRAAASLDGWRIADKNMKSLAGGNGTPSPFRSSSLPAHALSNAARLGARVSVEHS